MRQAGEPSVEEILESIKQVIARDNRAGPVASFERPVPAAPAPPPADPVDDEADDILELTETEPDAENNVPPEPADSLLSEDARAATRDSLTALASLAEPGVGGATARAQDNGIEALVRELLRPQLAEWLDRNLPRMVEQMVAAEIARIVGKR